MKKITCIADLKGLSYPGQLQGADLQGADLQGADLQSACLWRANLKGADLRGACLWRANLEGASLEGASLEGASLRSANLAGADLQNANLWNANLRGANIGGSNLAGADFAGADFAGADLRLANLERAKLPEFLVKLPPLGQSFIAWKKVRYGYILKLEIPADSPRVSTFIGRKCRAKSAKVLEAFHFSGDPTEQTEFQSLHDHEFIYRIGETVEVSDFDDDIRVECTRGIHFFETSGEAASYR